MSKAGRLLVVVDYQNDFVCGAAGFAQARAIETALSEKIDFCKRRGDDILFTLDTHFDEKYRQEAHQRGWEPYGRVRDALTPQTMRMSKHTYASPDMLLLLLEKQYDTIELTGVETHICVLANAVLARISLPEAEIRVDAGCVAASDPKLHEKALDIMEGLDIKVINRRLLP